MSPTIPQLKTYFRVTHDLINVFQRPIDWVEISPSGNLYILFSGEDEGDLRILPDGDIFNESS